MRAALPVAAALLMAVSISLVHAQEAARAPAGLLDAAGASPGVFVHYLVEASVPAGIELRQSEMPLKFPKPLALDRQTLVPLATLVTAFNKRHDEYRAELMNGVFVIRPVASRCQYLDRPAPAIGGPIRGVMAATRRLFAPLDPKLASIPESGSPVGGPDVDGDAITVTLDTAGRSVIAAMNDLVVQAPSRAWLALTSDAESAAVLQIGFIRPNAFSVWPVKAIR